MAMLRRKFSAAGVRVGSRDPTQMAILAANAAMAKTKRSAAKQRKAEERKERQAKAGPRRRAPRGEQLTEEERLKRRRWVAGWCARGWG